MATVIGVRFKNAGKLYFFDPGQMWPTAGDFVVVETARGIEFGEVVIGVREIDDSQIIAPLKKVVRVASAQDVEHAQENARNEKEAYKICQKKIIEHKLDMKLVSVEYTFDNSKILFYFTANGRVDFRSLVKDLASVFKTRIELRQIGVRDEAKMLGGLGPCGRPICCGAFLGDFQPVSIKMAKEQNLSLNPTKISGVCGRLMCCLKYEQETYEQTRKRMPKVGKEVITPDGVGVVWDINVIKETVKVRIQKGDSSELKDFGIDEIQRPAQPAQQPKEKASESDKAEKGERGAKGERKPRNDEKPPRREKADKDVNDEKQPSSDLPKDEATANEEERKEPKAQKEEVKPAVSPWQQAVAAALKAAQQNTQPAEPTEPEEPAEEEDAEVLREQDMLDGKA
ncbi:MAG: stage 0 sporulation protein [Clostridia bacterium]|nr:stage 0 sporulation protein [Clostridia bacterium]